MSESIPLDEVPDVVATLRKQRDELLRVLRGGLHLLRTPADPVPHDVSVCKCLVCKHKREAFEVIAACEEV